MRVGRTFLTTADRFDFVPDFFSLVFETTTSFVNVRLNKESNSSVIEEISSFNSGVGERLVVQFVDEFKPESLVVIVAAHGDDNRRMCFDGESI